jgi:Fe-S oxidoreductase
VGLEPSCVSVFRDELINMYPNDPLAIRMSKQTFTLGEFLSQQAADFELPKLDRKVLVQGHCHQKAIMQMTGEEDVLARMGTDFQTLDAGCCGLAGVFGFERDHYETSIAIAELALLPALRAADPDTLIVADGFSCREQIMGNSDRQPMHLAQLIQLALRTSR